MVKITIDLEHPNYKKINLTFKAIPSLQAIPVNIIVFNAKANQSVLRSIQLRDNQADSDKDAPFQIESVTSKNESRVDVRRVTMNKTGCELELQIWPFIDDTTKSFSADQLIIKMKDGRELSVPMRVFYQSGALSSAGNSSSMVSVGLSSCSCGKP